MSDGRASGVREKKGLKQGQGCRQRKRAKHSLSDRSIHKAKKHIDREREKDSDQELKSYQ